MIDVLLMALLQAAENPPAAPAVPPPVAAQVEAEAGAVAEEESERVVVRAQRRRCREATTGSRLARAECVSERDAQIERDQARENLRAPRYIPNTPPSGGPS